MDNFVEINVRYKRLGFTRTRTQGILFDLYAWFLLWQHFGWDFDILSKKSPDELATGMLYTGAVSYNRFKGIRVAFIKQDVDKWVDEIPTGKMKEIGKVLMDSMKVLEPIRAADESKKK